jgi:hypothetical protein
VSEHSFGFVGWNYGNYGKSGNDGNGSRLKAELHAVGIFSRGVCGEWDGFWPALSAKKGGDLGAFRNRVFGVAVRFGAWVGFFKGGVKTPQSKPLSRCLLRFGIIYKLFTNF